MTLEQDVSAHYTRGQLEEKILNALRAMGKDPANLRPEDIAALDNFHVGGHESTEALSQFMDLQPGMQILDVGCGIGGPARYFGALGYSVTGIDLTEEFVQTAESLTKLVKLQDRVEFRQASAVQIPFDAKTFDRAYMIHVGMNIEDKAGAFREVARVLKPGGKFAVFDIMRNREGEVVFPMPWALTPRTSFVASKDEYRKALEAAGFRIVHERDRTQFGLEFTRRMMERAAAGSVPVQGVQVLMGDQMPLMIKNITAAMASGALAPVELVGKVS